jgi:hypothetical protein
MRLRGPLGESEPRWSRMIPRPVIAFAELRPLRRSSQPFSSHPFILAQTPPDSASRYRKCQRMIARNPTRGTSREYPHVNSLEMFAMRTGPLGYRTLCRPTNALSELWDEGDGPSPIGRPHDSTAGYCHSPGLRGRARTPHSPTILRLASCRVASRKRSGPFPPRRLRAHSHGCCWSRPGDLR